MFIFSQRALPTIMASSGSGSFGCGLHRYPLPQRPTVNPHDCPSSRAHVKQQEQMPGSRTGSQSLGSERHTLFSQESHLKTSLSPMSPALSTDTTHAMINASGDNLERSILVISSSLQRRGLSVRRERRLSVFYWNCRQLCSLYTCLSCCQSK